MAWFDRWKRKPTAEVVPNANLVVDEHENNRPLQLDTLGQAIGLSASLGSAKSWYHRSSWVYACNRYVASACASVPWYVRERRPNGEYERVLDHPAERLLNFPNPVMSGRALKEQSVGQLNERGNSIWVKFRTIRGLEEILPVDSTKIVPVLSSSTIISHYLFGRKKVPIEVGDVIHFRLMDPDCWWWGMSPLEPAGLLADCEVKALEWWRNSIMNRCIKDGLLSFKHDLTPEQATNTNQILRDQLIGPQNARGPMVAGHEATYTPWTMTPAEMDYTKSRSMMKEELCCLFGIPPVLMIPDNSSYNNIETARIIFWLDTVMSFLDNQKATLDTQFITEYLKPGQIPGDLDVMYDVSRVDALLKVLGQKVDIAVKFFSIGVPLNQIVRVMNFPLPPIEGGDIGYVTANVTPIGQPEGPAPDTQPAVGEPPTPDQNPRGSLPEKPANGKPAGSPSEPSRNGAPKKHSEPILY